jgi:hypothetical protein
MWKFNYCAAGASEQPAGMLSNTRTSKFNLRSGAFPLKDCRMGLPAEPITLSVAQVADLNHKLSEMRHNVNNNLALMVAAVELLRRKPDMAIKMADSISGQTNKMMDEIAHFSAEFEKTLGITREAIPGVVEGTSTFKNQ